MNDAAKSTIGQAIDQAMSALSQLEKREQQIVISTLCSLLDILPNANTMGGAQGGPFSTGRRSTPDGADEVVTKVANPKAVVHPFGTTASADQHGLDIRTLRNQKQPATALHMACVVAYYLQEHAPEEERTREITTSELERLFKQAGFKLPSRMQQVLVDAKSAGYFESVDRGKYKLTRVGYNLVTHSLPKASKT